jgi:hypothetical protein
MLFDPAGWYAIAPGVPETGPLKPHFVRDIGCAYILTGFALAGLAFNERAWPAALIGALFLRLHALVHVADGFSGRVTRTMSSSGPLSAAPAWPLGSRECTARRVARTWSSCGRHHTGSTANRTARMQQMAVLLLDEYINVPPRKGPIKYVRLSSMGIRANRRSGTLGTARGAGRGSGGTSCSHIRFANIASNAASLSPRRSAIMLSRIAATSINSGSARS